jgi:hypothetical protein
MSYGLKPLWLERNFIFSLPILYIALGASIAKLAVSPTLKLIIPIGILAVNISHWPLIADDKVKGDAFDEVVLVLKDNLSNSDKKLCVVSHRSLHTFWSLQRYLNEINWGNPLDTQPKLNDRWQQIAKKLPNSLIDVFALNPHPNFTETKDLIISTENTDRCHAEDVGQTLIVADNKVKDLASLLVFRNSDYSIYQQ